MDKKWYDNEISLGIMKRKYLHEGETPDEFIPRVASIFSQDLKDSALEVLSNADFLPAGRTLFGAGFKGARKLSLSNCFVAGTQVLTTNGFKNIEHVLVGDYVITSQGVHRVNNTMSRHYVGDLYKLSSKYFLSDIICTPNHQFLTPNGWVRADRFFPSYSAHTSMKIKLMEYRFPKTYPVIDLCAYYTDSNKDRIVFYETEDRIIHETFNGRAWQSYSSSVINRYLYLTEDFRYFIGRWLGDGSITQRRGKRDHSIVQLVFNATTEVEAAQRCIQIGTQAFGIMPSVRTTEQNVIAVRWENPIIGTFFYKEFGSGYNGKHLNPMFLGDFMIALGLLDSDGMISTHGNVSITLANAQLIWWLQLTLAMNGICSATVNSANNGAAYQLRIPNAVSRKYIVPYMTKSYHDKRHNVMPSTEHADWAPVEDVQIIENVDTQVFNLSVDDVHEYNVNGAICHNCYILPTMTDSIESIFDTAKMLARISSYGGGSGLSIDNLRPKGAPVNNSALTSTGAVSFLNIFDVTGSTIGQNGRRAAIMVGLRCDHPDIEEFLKIKQNNEKLASMNISIKFTDEFMKAVEDNKNFTLHFESPETGKIEKVINARDFFMEFCETQYSWGDPGAIFIDRVRSYQTLSGYEDYRIDISNPCLAGYTRILTDQGYFPIASLVDQEVNIWNGYQFSKVVPKITGYNQKMVRVSFSNGVAIDCTLYHKFLMADGSRKEAKDLQIDDKLCKWKYVPIEGYKHVNRKIMYTHGFFSGDGYLGKHHAVLALYGVKKNLLEAFNYERAIEQQTANTSDDTRLHVNLVEDGIIPYLKNWVPDASYSIDARLYWLAGLIDSDGCLNSSEGSISISSIDYQFLHDVQLLLNTLGVSTSIGILREAGVRAMPANNGTGEYKDYYCQTTYRLIISAASAAFLSSIGLMLYRVRLTPTPNRDAARFIRVTAIESIPDAETVYCLNEPINHSFVAEGVLVGNCAEFFGTGGNSCNLGSINIYNMIDNKFTDHARINYDKLAYVTDIAVKMLDEVLDYGQDMQPLELNKQIIDDWRSIGLGIFGLADAFVALGVKYGSPQSCEIAQSIMKWILLQAITTSSNLAKEKGSFGKFDVEKSLKSPIFQLFPELHDMIRSQGLRHGTFLSIAPTGTISLFAGKFTGGLEPMFKIAYTRTSHSMEDSKKTFTVYARGVEDLLKYHGCENITPEEAKKKFPFLVESHEIPYSDRVKFQAALQTYVDNAISSTVNLPNSATVEDIYNIYMEAWKAGVKGITIFRDGCKRGNILGVDDKKVALPEGVIPEFDTIDPPSRREIKIIDGTTVHESTSCVKSMYVTVNKTPEGKAFEIFTNASGGCKTNINTIARLVSLSLRSGVKVDRIIEELRANQCPACQVLRRQGKQVALSCSNAIADAIESAMGKIKSKIHNHTSVKKEEESTIKRECPECGKKTLRPEGKCVTCYNCGWSKCE